MERIQTLKGKEFVLTYHLAVCPWPSYSTQFPKPIFFPCEMLLKLQRTNEVAFEKHLLSAGIYESRVTGLPRLGDCSNVHTEILNLQIKKKVQRDQSFLELRALLLQQMKEASKFRGWLQQRHQSGQIGTKSLELCVLTKPRDGAAQDDCGSNFKSASTYSNTQNNSFCFSNLLQGMT